MLDQQMTGEHRVKLDQPESQMILFLKKMQLLSRNLLRKELRHLKRNQELHKLNSMRIPTHQLRKDKMIKEQVCLISKLQTNQIIAMDHQVDKSHKIRHIDRLKLKMKQ